MSIKPPATYYSIMITITIIILKGGEDMTRRKLLNIGNAGLRSEIKRLNERIASIGRRFGKDSEVYKATIAPLTSDKFKQYRGESAS